MKPRLQTSLGQHLVLTPQLRQAIHLLQLSALELDAELAAAVESNPLLDWAEPEPLPSVEPEGERATDAAGGSAAFPADDLPPWTRGAEPRSDDGRVGNEWGDPCKSLRSPYS